jgi:hypothetical protein
MLNAQWFQIGIEIAIENRNLVLIGVASQAAQRMVIGVTTFKIII